MTETIEPMVMGEDEKQALAHRLVDQAREQGSISSAPADS